MTNTQDKKLWGGRFAEATDGLVELFNASVGFDQRLAEQDIRGSLAHVAMLGQVGILSAEEVAQITDGLNAVLADIRAGSFEWRLDGVEVHMIVEAALRLHGPLGEVQARAPDEVPDSHARQPHRPRQAAGQERVEEGARLRVGFTGPMDDA